MNFLDKIKLKTGVKERNNFDLSSDHITTSDFFRISPVLSIPTVPSGKYNVKAQTFTRLSPMTQPVLGRCTIHNRCFFVPFPIIMHCWNAFITDSPYSDNSVSNVIPSKVTTFEGKDLASFFLQSNLSAVVSGSVAHDFVDYSSGSTQNRALTAYGRRCWNILQSLGYKVPLGAATRALMSTPDNTYNVEYSALKLLAFYKIYKDWYANQAYNQAAWDNVFYKVNGSLDLNDLNNIFGMISLAMYDKDYFTAASDNPVNPNNVVNSSYVLRDITNDKTSTSSSATHGWISAVSSSGSPTSTSPSSPTIKGQNTNGSISTLVQTGNISQFLIDQLKALTDYLKRNNLVGSKPADRMLARFGVKPSDAELHMSIPVGSDDTLVQISDVMSTAMGTASSSGTNRVSYLGDYAGKGIGYGKGGFYYESNDYGILMVVSTIIPKIGYVNGTSRFNTMYMNRLDFFTPEFDGKSGVQAIRSDELKSDYLALPPTGYAPSQPISFIPRWADLKIGQDNLSGDFCINSRRGTMDSWHLFRLFDDSTTQAQLKHSEAFTRGEQSQYDRIFAYTGTDYDHFILIYNFDVKASLPMTKLFDNYEFEGGREITMEVNGKQFN